MASEVVPVRMDAEVLMVLDGLVGHFKEGDGKITRGHVIRWAVCQMAERLDIDVTPGAVSTGSVVYFVQSTGPSGVIKIGSTARWAYRLKELGKAHPVPLKVLGTLPGDKLTEDGIHLMFEHVRARGEWFLPDPVLLAFISERCGPASLNGSGATKPVGVPESVVPSEDEKPLEEDEDFDKMFET
jgi:hypothetical protein